jgi:hypothetical protein
MRKSVSAGIAAAMTALAITVVGPALPASAAPAACGNPVVGYPPGSTSSAQLALSTTFAHPGDTIEASGTHYRPNEDVTIYITGTMTECKPSTFANGIKVGTGHTDANGSFDPSIVVPQGLSGNVTVYGIGASLLPYDYSTQPLSLAGAGGSSGSTQPPAHTGVDIALMLTAGGVLLGAGIIFTRGGKRRRAASHG